MKLNMKFIIFLFLIKLLLDTYSEQEKKRPAYIFLSYLKLKYQKIYFWLNYEYYNV